MGVNPYPPKPGSPLSLSEIRILAGLARGHSNQQIGHTLGLSPLTVKTHLARMGLRLGNGHRAALVDLGYQHGYLQGLTTEPRPYVELTARQQQMLEGIAAGLTDPEIGERHRLTADTVKCHLRGLYAALGASGRAHAVALAHQHGHLTTTTRPAALEIAA